MSNLAKWTEQIFIFLAHIALLAWILFVLGNGGALEIKTTMLHLLGLALYGGLLIRISSFLAMRRFKKEKYASKS